MNRFEVASIYVRQAGINGVRWYEGPVRLEVAHRVIAEAAADEASVHHDMYRVLYYELRGLDGCAVRYRLWIERPDPFVRTEVLTVRSPGGHTARSVSSAP